MIRFPTSPNVPADLLPLFRHGLQASRLKEGEVAVIYADTFTNPLYTAGFLGAAKDLGAEAFQIIQPLVPHDLSRGVGRAQPTPTIVKTMQAADFVVDVTTGGMLYSAEQSSILAAGTRVLRVREPDDCLLRLMPSEEVKGRAQRGEARFAKANEIRLVFDDGASQLVMEKGDRIVTTQYGMADEPGRWDHWATGLICTTPVEDTVNGTLVVSPASIVFPFGTYVTDPIRIHFEGGSIVSIEGGREAVMLRDLIERQGDDNARRIAHIGWGLERRARWDTLATRGWNDSGGVETRSVYGNILIALGENGDLGGQNSSRLHIDISLRSGRLDLDGEPIVEDGRFHAAELG